MTAVTEGLAHWLEEFTRQEPAKPWLQEVRKAGFQRFTETGFPTTHDEEWRFTNVAAIARKPWRVGPYHADRFHLLTVGPWPDGLRGALTHSPLNNPFAALNTAFLGNIVFHEVPRGCVLDRPIEVTHEANEEAAYHPRTVILVGPNAQCAIVETYKGQGRYFTNAVTQIIAAENAVVDHYKVQLESPDAYHIATLDAQLGRSANFSSHSIALGGALVRNDANATLSEGTEATLNGLYIVNGTQHIDNHTSIDHAMPHGTSHELYKGILDGKATAVFNGRIIVRKDAQKTDSKQTNKNLVLSDDAVINTKPELQILADDVRCTHGATIGQLDSESLFYLRSRGIARDDARDLLTYAFAQDIVDRIKVQPLRDSLERLLFEKFNEHSR